MTDPNDSTVGAFVGFVACMSVATLLYLTGHYIGRFHRAGVQRLRAHQQRQENAR